jgi:hypothetical protein
MPTLDALENGMVGVCIQQCPPPSMKNFSHSCTISTLKTSEKKTLKNNESGEKQWKKQLWTLGYILVLKTMSFPLSSIFWFRPIEFLSKIVPCR